MRFPVDQTVQQLLNKRLEELEKHFDADVLSYFGPIADGNEQLFLQLLEDLSADPAKRKKLMVVLTTPGGSAIAVERYVNMIRHHYDELDLLVPDYAYSAGTIFCMSADNIHMDYYSVLGPIDPQVLNKDGKWVAALGYLDKVNELLEKAREKKLSQAEFLILKDIDLAELRGYEQAKAHTIDLLKKWLVKHKFKNWTTHRTNPVLIGQAVTEDQKLARAEEIAAALSDNTKWKTHGRPINLESLKELRLEIEDYSSSPFGRRELVREYSLLMFDYIRRNSFTSFIHTRHFI
ncbi:MAG: serine dehydrogenasease [Bacteroidetes bacterium]|nr:serine dehydrogenasease [Bacteroidota bacterium]MBS1941532.1 serine dehydrogenasease [Bacteroidota bacterium]